MEKGEIFKLLFSFTINKSVPEYQLQWLTDKSEWKILKAGNPVFNPWDLIQNNLVILKGEFKLCTILGIQEVEIGSKKAGDVSGFLPFSGGKTASGNGKVTQESTILFFGKSYEKEMLRDHYELCQALAHGMTSRVRESTNFQ